MAMAVNMVLLGAVAGLWLAPGRAAASPGGEVLYLSESHDDGTTLYQVNLDWTTGRADLVPLADLGDGPGVIPFEFAKAIACTPDGARIYAIDQYSLTAQLGGGMLGYYDVGNATWQPVGFVEDRGDIVPGIVLAAFSPLGELYVASETTESLYTVDVWTGQAALVGQIMDGDTGAVLNVLGADIAFTPEGDLYLWTNGESPGALRGLYRVALPAVGGIAYAQFIGTIEDTFFTGLALRANGFGDLVGSENRSNQIVVVSKTDGGYVDAYDMYLEGAPYDYFFGDMTVGPLALTTRTIGYYKNHSWGGASVSICGIEVDEEIGKTILWGARGNNFSMLFAQLIAAKLNTFNATGISVIDDAEAWLCDQGVFSGGELLWNAAFTSKQQKSTAGMFSGELDYFNNLYDY